MRTTLIRTCCRFCVVSRTEFLCAGQPHFAELGFRYHYRQVCRTAPRQRQKAVRSSNHSLRPSESSPNKLLVLTPTCHAAGKLLLYVRHSAEGIRVIAAHGFRHTPKAGDDICEASVTCTRSEHNCHMRCRSPMILGAQSVGVSAIHRVHQRKAFPITVGIGTVSLPVA